MAGKISEPTLPFLNLGLLFISVVTFIISQTTITMSVWYSLFGISNAKFGLHMGNNSVDVRL